MVEPRGRGKGRGKGKSSDHGKKQRQFPKSSNIRSDEAIRRRAEKRGVSFEEQLRADIAKAHQLRQKRQAEQPDKEEQPNSAEGVAKPAKKKAKHSGTEKPNQGGRAVANSEEVPKAAKTSQKQPAAKGTAETGTSAKLPSPLGHWPEQAGPERIEYNQKLRQRYAEDPTSLSAEELERAKVLAARDARKQAKKHEIKALKANTASNLDSGEHEPRAKGKGKGKGKGRGRGGEADNAEVQTGRARGRGRGRGRGDSS